MAIIHHAGLQPDSLWSVRSALSQNGTSAASATASSVPQSRLVQAAHEFEASLMQELMAPLLPGHSSLDNSEDSGSDSALSAFAGEAFGKALSEHGGLGIATRILHQLSADGNHSGKTPVPKPNPVSTTNATGQ